MNEPFGPADVGLLDQVQPKMKVVDADGVELGSVEDVSMSDAGAVTTARRGLRSEPGHPRRQRVDWRTGAEGPRTLAHSLTPYRLHQAGRP